MPSDRPGGTTAQRAELGPNVVVELAAGHIRIGRRIGRAGSASPLRPAVRACWLLGCSVRRGDRRCASVRAPRSARPRPPARLAGIPPRAGATVPSASTAPADPSCARQPWAHSSVLGSGGILPPSGKTHEGPPALMAGDPSSSACVRRRPTLPPRLQGSTIGAEGLSFRVRNGTGRFPFAMAAVTLWRCGRMPDRISGTAQWTQQMCGQVLGLLVPVSSTCFHASTSGLSTQSSSGGLTRSTLWETSS